jgi:hypothetical protein
MTWLSRMWRKLTRKYPVTVELHIPLVDGRTTGDAISIAVTAIGAGLRELGADISDGNVNHHTHCYDGVDIHHAVWVRDGYEQAVAR